MINEVLKTYSNAMISPLVSLVMYKLTIKVVVLYKHMVYIRVRDKKQERCHKDPASD